VCLVDNGCDLCNYPCADNEYMVSGNCITAGNSTCYWSKALCQEKSLTPCTCDDVGPTPCAFGLKRDWSIEPTCLRGVYGNCILQSTCIPDTCGGQQTTPCQCDYSECIYVSAGNTSAAHNVFWNFNSGFENSTSDRYEGCFAPNSDTFKTLVDFPVVKIIASPPDYCVSQIPPTSPTSPDCESCKILENCRNLISNQIQMTVALDTFINDQQNIWNSVDKVTGSALGKHFSVSMIVIAIPSLRYDESLDLTVVVNFNPISNVIAPTKDHLRVFCPSIKKFLSKLANFNESDSDSSDCQWNQVVHGVPTQYSTFTSSVNFPSTAVKRVFAPTMFIPPPTQPSASTSTSTPTTSLTRTSSAPIMYRFYFWIFIVLFFII